MMITEDFSKSLAMGAAAPHFELFDTDQRSCTPESFSQSDLMVLQFTCNHCPYVLGSDDRLRALVADFAKDSVVWVGICSNDPERFPQDNFVRMQERAPILPYRYLHDPSQQTARAYGAQVTPEFFIFARQGGAWALRWHGTIDDSPRDAGQVTTAYLEPALRSLLADRPLVRQTTPVQGCSIKWAD
jgi:peroxiredoxin